MKHSVIISLASNIDAASHLSLAREQLASLLESFSTTREILTPAVGGAPKDRPYLNQLAVGTTALSAEELILATKEMERSLGRSTEDKAKGLVPIDLDLLSYDGVRYHQADWQRPYVQALLNKEGQPELTE